MQQKFSEEQKVRYEGKPFKIIRVWNHGYCIWYDLIAIEPVMEGINYFKEALSVLQEDIEILSGNE